MTFWFDLVRLHKKTRGRIKETYARKFETNIIHAFFESISQKHSLEIWLRAVNRRLAPSMHRVYY